MPGLTSNDVGSDPFRNVARSEPSRVVSVDGHDLTCPRSAQDLSCFLSHRLCCGATVFKQATTVSIGPDCRQQKGNHACRGFLISGTATAIGGVDHGALSEFLPLIGVRICWPLRELAFP